MQACLSQVDSFDAYADKIIKAFDAIKDANGEVGIDHLAFVIFVVAINNPSTKKQDKSNPLDTF